jgi:uncharacterized membrane protein YfcA
MSVDAVFKSPLVRIPARYGLISGLLGVGAAISFYYMGRHPFWLFPLFDPRVIFMAIFMFFALREIREYYFSGVLYFWQGMMACMVMMVVMAVTGFLGIEVFGRIDEGFLTQYVKQGKEQLDQLTPAGCRSGMLFRRCLSDFSFPSSSP